MKLHAWPWEDKSTGEWIVNLRVREPDWIAEGCMGPYANREAAKIAAFRVKNGQGAPPDHGYAILIASAA